jgi:hypothetical protein
MKIAGSVAVLIMFFSVATAYASIPELQYSNKRSQHVTDYMLEKIAVEKGIIPKDADEAFFNAEIKKKNLITIWIIIDNKTRLALIDNLRELNYKDGVIIRLPSEYYAGEITDDIYNSIVKGDIVVMELGNVFKTIAIMEGDYDNGKDKVAVAKEYMGEDGFQMYQRMYPEKYEKLIRK